MLFCIVWRRRYLVAVLILGLAFGIGYAWPSLREAYDDQPRQGELSQIEITGKWRLWRLMEGSTLTVHKPVGGTYPIEFLTGGCMGGWKSKSRGHYADGVLTLNTPIKEYGSFAYRRFYVVRAADTDYLVPDFRLGEFRRKMALSERAKREIWLDFLAFRNKPPRPIDQDTD